MKKTTFLFLLLFTCTAFSFGQTFGLKLKTDTIVIGVPQQLMDIEGELINNSSSMIDINVVRFENNIPVDWSTSMCLDVCYPPNVDSAIVSINAGDSVPFRLTFNTGIIADSGNIYMVFKNENNSSDYFTQRLYCVTDSALSYVENNLQTSTDVRIYPNPMNISSTIEIHDSRFTIHDLKIYDIFGKEVMKSQITNHKSKIGRNNLPDGVYFYQLSNASEEIKAGKLIILPSQ